MTVSQASTAAPRCMICGGETSPYFTKEFKGDCGLETVDYRQCGSCGFAFSATHFALDPKAWGEVNRLFHQGAFEKDSFDDDPRWDERMSQQVDILDRLNRNGVFDRDLPNYDYGCGYGKLANLLAGRDMPVGKYEKYLPDVTADYLTDEDIDRGGFGVVITTSVVEHVMEMETLDKIANSVHPERGVLAMHTWVGEVVPQDPSWFYLLPVHVSFYTNESMRLLMKRWDFVASVYVVDARMWLFFRDKAPAKRAYDLLKAVREDVYYGDGFADYWK